MARTTLTIEDGLLRNIKKRAADEGRTVQEVVNDLLRQGLARSGRTAYALELPTWVAREQPGVDLLDRDKLFDVMDGR